MEYVIGIALSAILGAVFGSYATLFAYRLPLNESCFGRYFGEKSKCPQCGATIKTRDLIPLLNWFFTLGRCSSCKGRIPRTHLFIEVTTTILFVLCYLKFSLSEDFIIYSLIAVGVVILVATDFSHKLFPSSVLNFILIIGLVNRVLQDGTIVEAIFSGAIGIFFAAIFYEVFYKRTSGLFATQAQSLDYTKFILVASLCLQPYVFLFYFFTIMTIFTMFLLFDIPSKRKHNSYSYVMVIPFFWLLVYSPIFFSA